MRLKSPEYDAFLKEVEARHSVTLYVVAGASLPMGLGSLSIYVDGNIQRTPLRLRERATRTTEVIPLVPGAHRVVVREAEVHKINRLESNSLYLELGAGEEVALNIQLSAGNLELSRTDV